MNRRFLAALALALVTALVGPALWSAASAAINPATLPDGALNEPYSQDIDADMGPDSAYVFTVSSGSLPGGLTLIDGATDLEAVLSGTPTAEGSFTFEITASGFNGRGDVVQSYTVNIVDPAVAVAPLTLPDGVVGTAYDETVTASAGTAPYTFTVTAGSLPDGLTLDAAGAVTGTPTAAGSSTVTITATDSSAGTGPYTGSQEYTFVIAAADVPEEPVVVDDDTTDVPAADPVNDPADGALPDTGTSADLVGLAGLVMLVGGLALVGVQAARRT